MRLTSKKQQTTKGPPGQSWYQRKLCDVYVRNNSKMFFKMLCWSWSVTRPAWNKHTWSLKSVVFTKSLNYWPLLFYAILHHHRFKIAVASSSGSASHLGMVLTTPLRTLFLRTIYSSTSFKKLALYPDLPHIIWSLHEDDLWFQTVGLLSTLWSVTQRYATFDEWLWGPFGGIVVVYWIKVGLKMSVHLLISCSC